MILNKLDAAEGGRERAPESGVGAGVGTERGDVGAVQLGGRRVCAWLDQNTAVCNKLFQAIRHLHNSETSGILGSITRHMCLLSVDIIYD